jgi:hypothetical protein
LKASETLNWILGGVVVCLAGGIAIGVALNNK